MRGRDIRAIPKRDPKTEIKRLNGAGEKVLCGGKALSGRKHGGGFSMPVARGEPRLFP